MTWSACIWAAACIFSGLGSVLCWLSMAQAMAEMTRPPATSTMGREMPKKLRTAEPMRSTKTR